MAIAIQRGADGQVAVTDVCVTLRLRVTWLMRRTRQDRKFWIFRETGVYGCVLAQDEDYAVR